MPAKENQNAARQIDTSTPRPLFVGMRWQLFAGSVLVFAAGVPLFLLTEQTERYFAWTINPPLLTAAFLGAAYWASFFIGWLASREQTWANARLAVPGPLLFTVMTLIATWLHIDRFHFNSPDTLTQLFTWVWLAIYAGVPLSMSVMLILQLRVPGGDPPRAALLPVWLRVVLGILAVAMLALGIALFVAPQAASQLWAWQLTPLTARAIAAWLIALGVIAAQAARENDLRRVRPVMIGFILFGVLQSIALARYPGDVAWRDARTWVYLFFLLMVFLVGASGWLGLRRAVQPSVAR